MYKKLIGLAYILWIMICPLFWTKLAESKAQPYNIFFILVDAARPDHFSSYGYGRKTTPNFDNIAQEGVLFENAISQAWYTLPSHASIFTSKYMHTHKVVDINNFLPESEITLAEMLKGAGYHTAAFVGGVFLEPVYGLNQGFDTYYSVTAAQPEVFPLQLGRSRAVVPKAMKWLEENKEHPFFLFVHNYDLFIPTNVPYEYKMDKGYEGIADELLSLRRLNLRETYRHTYLVGSYQSMYVKEVQLNDNDKRHIISDYDDGLTYSDSWHKKLFDKLKELKLTDNTIIIITADHGSDLLGHGKLRLYGEGSVYDELLRVPLIIKHPGLPTMMGKKISSQVQLIDLMPTILDFVGITPGKKIEGKSLLPLLKDGSPKEVNKYTYSGWKWMRAVRTNEWKLIYQDGLYELYNLKNDPGERTNLAGKRSPELLILLEKLFAWSLRESPDRNENFIKIDERMKKSLREAGYW